MYYFRNIKISVYLPFVCTLITCRLFVGSSDEAMDQIANDAATQTKASPQRTINTVHVCWHRNASICMQNELTAVEVSV